MRSDQCRRLRPGSGGLELRNRDRRHRLDESPAYASIPFFLTLEPGRGGTCVGFLLETFGASRFDLGREDPERVELSWEAGGFDLSVIPGPTRPRARRPGARYSISKMTRTECSTAVTVT